jgi:tetratricopeptide (TPR) repeat protein
MWFFIIAAGESIMAKKKQANEPDEFLESLQRAFKYVMDNIKVISMIAGAIVAGVLIILLVFYQIRLNKVKEAVVLNQAVLAYHVGKTDEALTAFTKISGNNNVNAAMAELYIGNILYEQGKFEEALGHFEKVSRLSAAPELSSIRGLGQQGKAYAEMALKRIDKAEQAFQGMGELYQDLSLLELGRLHLLQGDREQAIQKFEELISEFPDSPWVSTAEALKD